MTGRDRKAWPDSVDADRGSNGSVTRFAGGSNGNAAADGGGSSMGGASPFNSAASQQSSGGLSGGLKSRSFNTVGSGGPLGFDPPALCVPPAARASLMLASTAWHASNSAPSRPLIVLVDRSWVSLLPC